MKLTRIGTCILVGVLVASILAFSGCQSSKSESSPNSTTIEEMTNESEALSEASQSDGINFSLDQYTNHGELSCNRIWCSKYVWDNELDMNVEQFAYFDADGKQKSSWFNCDIYVPSDFVNDFVILSENTENKKSSEKNDVHKFIYNLDFKNIATVVIDKHDPDSNDVTQFNEYGYAFTGGQILYSNGVDFTYPGNGYYKNLAYIDKTGAHLFDDDVELVYNHSADINSDIYCEKDYIIVSDRFVCNKEGKLLVDVKKAVESSGKLEDYYTFDLDEVKGLSMSERYDIVQFRDLAFVDDKNFSVEFVVGNLNSNVTVVFNCTLDINGNIVKGPEKIYSGDL